MGREKKTWRMRKWELLLKMIVNGWDLALRDLKRRATRRAWNRNPCPLRMIS